MVTDLRVQRRTIEIRLKSVGYSFDLDEEVDDIMEDIETILRQRKSTAQGLVKIEVILT